VDIKKVFKIESFVIVMKREVGVYILAFVFIAIAFFGISHFGNYSTGFAVLNQYATEDSCASGGYTWTNTTTQNCSTVTNCVNTTVDCEPCLQYEDINGTQGNCTSWSSCTNETCRDEENCVAVVTGGQCTGDICGEDHLSLCSDETNCSFYGGHWYDGGCHFYECSSDDNCDSGYECVSHACSEIDNDEEALQNETESDSLLTEAVVPLENTEATQLSSIDIPESSLYSGDSEVIKWTVTNSGMLPLYSCNLKFGDDYASWISFNENAADIGFGSQKEFSFGVSVPKGTADGAYTLTVSIDCVGITNSKTYVVNVLNEKLGLDIVDIERTNKGKVRVDYSLEELSGQNQTVEVNFSLLNSEGQEVSNASENRNLSSNLTKEFKIYIPINKSLEGNLTLFVVYDSAIYSSSLNEPVILGSPVGGFAIFEGIGTGGSIILVLVVLLVLAAVFVVVRKIRRKYKFKKNNSI
jgi:hypothetical protein